jgi:hypothetical protein
MSAAPAVCKCWQYGAAHLDDMEAIIRRVDADHAEPLRALEIGDDYEIPQSGAPPIYIVRVS